MTGWVISLQTLQPQASARPSLVRVAGGTAAHFETEVTRFEGQFAVVVDRRTSFQA
jgi:hypothetical protein